MSHMVAEPFRSMAATVMEESLQSVGEQHPELSVEERYLLSVVCGSIAGDRHAAWRIIASDEQKEKFKGMEQQASHAKEYVANVEGELQRIRDGIPALMDENLIPSSSTGESKEKGLITCVINRLQTSTDLKGFDMMTAVRRLAEQEQSTALAQLRSRISAIMKFGAGADDDPFVKVKDLIMDFSRLQVEASSETNQKSRCDEETLMTAEKEDLEDDTAKHSSLLETAVPDACLTCDSKCKVANETCVKDNMFMVTGEITVAGKHETETLAVSLASEIIEGPVIQTQENTQQVMNTHVQYVVDTVEVEKSKIIEETVQRMKPIIREKIRQVIKHTDFSQLQFLSKVVDMPVVGNNRPEIRTVWCTETSESLDTARTRQNDARQQHEQQQQQST